jgi:hypothetical protein
MRVSLTIAGFSVQDPPGSLLTVFLGPNFIVPEVRTAKNGEKIGKHTNR